jgi:hypothetical protein
MIATVIGGSQFKLAKINPQGSWRWSKCYSATGNAQVLCTKKTNDGGYIIGGIYNVSSQNYSIGLIKTDSIGNLEWSKLYGEALNCYVGTTNIDDHLLTLIQTSDNGYAFTYATFNSNNNSIDFKFVKTDSEGFSGCNESTQLFNQSSIFVTLSNVNLVTYGNTTPLINSPATMMKRTPFPYTIACSENAVNDFFTDQDIFIYPNPFNNTLTLDNLPLEKIEIKIFNLLGETIYFHIYINYSEVSTFDFSFLRSGVYFIYLKSGGKLIRKENCEKLE